MRVFHFLLADVAILKHLQENPIPTLDGALGLAEDFFRDGGKRDRLPSLSYLEIHHFFHLLEEPRINRREFLNLRHAYAITSHKSQGSTFHTVFVDFPDMTRIRDAATFNRALYVAVTRASTHLAIAA